MLLMGMTSTAALLSLRFSLLKNFRLKLESELVWLIQEPLMLLLNNSSPLFSSKIVLKLKSSSLSNGSNKASSVQIFIKAALTYEIISLSFKSVSSILYNA